jgi:hypothetical protein
MPAQYGALRTIVILIPDRGGQALALHGVRVLRALEPGCGKVIACYRRMADDGLML